MNNFYHIDFVLCIRMVLLGFSEDKKKCIRNINRLVSNFLRVLCNKINFTKNYCKKNLIFYFLLKRKVFYTCIFYGTYGLVRII